MAEPSLFATLAGQPGSGNFKAGNGEGVSLRHVSPVSAVAFSPDSASLATACDDRSISLWNPGGERLAFDARHNKKLRALLFSPDGNLLASGGDDRAARLWRLGTAKQAANLQTGGSYVAEPFRAMGNCSRPLEPIIPPE